MFFGQGTADTIDGAEPVLWDAEGNLRDHKFPSAGPLEWPVDAKGYTVTHRYVYDGQQVMQRETSRSQSLLTRLVAGGPRIPSRTDVTRIINTPGPTVYLDSDGTVDAQMPDRFGHPWFMYRAREDDHYNFDAGRQLEFMRGTGILKPPALPESLYLQYPPFYAVALESDVLLGRRGRFGWRGMDRNFPLRLSATAPQDDYDYPSAWQYWLAGRSEGELIGLAVGGSVALAGMLLTGGWSAIGGLGLFGGGAGATAYGETFDPQDDTGRALRAVGKTGMILGGFAIATPWLAGAIGGLTAGATAVSPVLGLGVKLGLVGLGGYGVYSEGRAMYRDWRDSDVDWIEWIDRHGASAALMAYAGSRAGVRAGGALWRNRLMLRHPRQWHQMMVSRYQWRNVRARLGDEEWAQPGQPVHHRFIKRNTSAVCKTRVKK
jgi:hypothetical protein